jgi:aromatic-L-amino-acid decarboxylase
MMAALGRKKIPRYAAPMALELEEREMRRMGERALERILEHLRSLPEQPLHAVTGGKKLARSLREPLPERGVPFDRLMNTLFGRVIPHSLNTASPGYLAYIPGGGLFQAALADFIALATNRYSTVWLAAPGLVQLEENVVQWFCEVLGLPTGAGGLLTSGGSMANLIALVAARRDRLPPDFLSGVLYTSSQAHHSVAKAAAFAGFPGERVRSLPVDGLFRLDLAALEAAVTEDRAAGLQPFCVVGNAGTTNTGAVDDLQGLARISERERLWLHVDAAYGGFFAMTARGRARMSGIERADSVTLDPHKGLFLPYGTGCLLVRERASLRRAHAMGAAYMPPMQTDDDLVDFCELGPELSREARGLRVWLPLKMHGARTFRDALDEKLDLAQAAAARIRALPYVELIAEPELSLFAFRVRPPGETDERRLEELNRAVLVAVNDRQRVLLTGARVEGRFLIRVCVLSFRTHQDRLDACVEDVRAAVASVVGQEGT